MGNPEDRGFVVSTLTKLRAHSIRISNNKTKFLFRDSDAIPLKCRNGHRFRMGYNEALMVMRWTETHNKESFYLHESFDQTNSGILA